MANLYKYASSNDKTGYFLRGRSKSSGYYNLQTTSAANRLFSRLDYEAGRIPHTEGESLPGELTWRMYQVGLLETDTQSSALKNLSNNELREAFEESDEELSLSKTDLETLQSFIESYSGDGENSVTKLETLLETTAGNNSSSTSSNGDLDLSGAIESEQQSMRVDAANTSLDEIKDRRERFANRNNGTCNVTVEEIVSYPSGPQSFTQFWEHPDGFNVIMGPESFDENTFDYSIHHTMETGEEIEFSISDHTLLNAPDGLEPGTAGSFSEQGTTPQTDYDYIINFYSEYDSDDTPDGDFSLYLFEKPRMTHHVAIEDGEITSWTVEVTEHDWSQTLRLQVHRAAGKFLTAVIEYFEDVDRYQLDSPDHDFNDLSIEFTVTKLTEEQKENLREAIEASE